MIKGSLIVAFFIILCLPDYSQEIHGIVIDENTKQLLANVNVFFNGTTIGTKTDSKGSFKLIIPENQKLPLALSAIGYNSLLLTEYPTDKLLKILLVPKIYELDEVVVVSRRSLWEKSVRNSYLNIFRKQFIGQTVNAYLCKIQNEYDLVFQYNEDQQLLTAYSLKPLMINNKSLGYQIYYYLDSFVYSQEPYSLTYTGYFIFKEDSTLNEKDYKRAENRRRLAYLGSRMHFMRSLWENNLDSAGYIIKNSANEIIPYDSLVIQTDSSEKYLRKKGAYSIAYLSKVSRSSMELKHDTIYFNKLGYFDPYGINWVGEITRQRVADLLPFDYVPLKK
jgi:hypothetical protein